MVEPKWMADLDLASYRTRQGPELAAAWVWWLISRLPPEAREEAARAWRNGKMPKDVAVLRVMDLALEEEEDDGS